MGWDHLYKENPRSLRWLEHLKVPVQLLSAEEYGSLLERCGFRGFTYQLIPDRTPLSGVSQSQSFYDPQELQRFQEWVALLFSVRKPPQ